MINIQIFTKDYIGEWKLFVSLLFIFHAITSSLFTGLTQKSLYLDSCWFLVHALWHSWPDAGILEWKIRTCFQWRCLKDRFIDCNHFGYLLYFEKKNYIAINWTLYLVIRFVCYLFIPPFPYLEKIRMI